MNWWRLSATPFATARIFRVESEKEEFDKKGNAVKEDKSVITN